MYLNKHIFLRSGYFYYRMAIPNDLKHLFPFREIKQSLSTDDRKIAECQALGIEGKVQQAFSILRSGVFSQETLPQIINSIIPRVTRQSSAHLKLSDLIQKYIHQHDNIWTAKTKMEVSSITRLLIDILGNKHIQSLTRPMMVELRDTLEKLPPNLYKKYPGKCIAEVVCLPDIIPMSLVSVNKHMIRIGAILKYGVREGYLNRNIAEAMKIPIKRSIDEERSAYSNEEICKAIKLLSTQKVERRWIPLIGIYSGMRLDEICQLYVDDIHLIDGIWCFNINDEKDKKLKNLASRRIVPIHPFLLEQGFLNHVEQIKAEGHERFWPSLTYSNINGYSNLFGKWFQRFNRQRISQDKHKVFHSFRHSFANKLKQQGVSESIIAELLGHKNHSITMGRYGKRYEPRVLLEALKKLIF